MRTTSVDRVRETYIFQLLFDALLTCMKGLVVQQGYLSPIPVTGTWNPVDFIAMGPAKCDIAVSPQLGQIPQHISSTMYTYSIWIYVYILRPNGLLKNQSAWTFILYVEHELTPAGGSTVYTQLQICASTDTLRFALPMVSLDSSEYVRCNGKSKPLHCRA